jgi:hypothetical protein
MGIIMEIKLIVTREKFDDVLTIDDWMNFSHLSSKDVYSYMLKFVVDDNGNYVDESMAKNMFKTVKKSEWVKYQNEFTKAIVDAFVNPMNAGS